MIASKFWTITDGGACDLYAPGTETLPGLIDRTSGFLHGEDYEKNLNVYYWPNPSDSFFNLKFDKDDQVSIYVYDLNGRVVHQQYGITTDTYQFGESLKSGIYFARINFEEHTQVIKLIKQ